MSPTLNKLQRTPKIFFCSTRQHEHHNCVNKLCFRPLSTYYLCYAVAYALHRQWQAFLDLIYLLNFRKCFPNFIKAITRIWRLQLKTVDTCPNLFTSFWEKQGNVFNFCANFVVTSNTKPWVFIFVGFHLNGINILLSN